MEFALHGRKLSVAIILVSLALAALFLAQGSTDAIACALLPPRSVLPRSSDSGHAERPPGSDPPDYQAILKRNIFDPTAGPLWPRPESIDLTASTRHPPSTPEVPPPCDNSAKLIADVHSEQYPESSLVTLTSGLATPLLYREGSWIEDKEIVSILPEAVLLRRTDGRQCWLRLFVDKAATNAATNRTYTQSPEARSPMQTAMTNGLSEVEMDRNIHAANSNKFSIPRSFVDRILSHQAEVLNTTRVVPQEENGQMTGVRLYGIRRNGLLDKLGLQNGDLLRTINGFEMSNPDTALEAYSRLRTASNLAISVVRGGATTNIQYEITQ